ncbi:anhydro-N-acetylmuramic acid kinase [Mucilaginibacter sp. Bleaf8]|uniref:anhydro-N-acetylmuramic acid kinase n=1 Tax=Mucilaginibacter sp. Bleaf8 TaxID=2834430 RepID=UPI001BCD24F9|nr:anhydro-N-acetylmuramic acid kinase [Mucilaginibacter sp. Bleaf8]MBS7566191.1 anhydro-N-acetylmuramic acid kinase [Mucilaginibacter sp. Bleaf8]
MPSLNRNLQKLFTITQKPERLIIGLMSGTSLDGLDIAVCRFSGNGFDTRFELLKFITLPYDDAFRQEVKQVFAQRQTDLEKVCLLNARIGMLHADMIKQALRQWGWDFSAIDIIASHGQTIYHVPRRLHGGESWPNATLQIGDADHIAVQTGIITISDFRQKHIAAGGEGAPLALYGDVLLGSDARCNRILLNIGGIANLTWLPADRNEIICTDVGAGNTLIDAACRQYFNLPYDAGGHIAASGQVHLALLDALLAHPFFAEAAPKTTGPELFSSDYVQQARQRADATDILAADLVATLSAFTAEAIVRFVKYSIMGKPDELLLSGGGARNKFIVDYLKRALPGVKVADTDTIGLNADAKEAILFALLANEALCGEPVVVGNNPAVLMGKFSFPV